MGKIKTLELDRRQSLSPFYSPRRS